MKSWAMKEGWWFVKIGDLVYVPYFKEYGVIVKRVVGTHAWHIVYTSGYRSSEYEEDMELVSCR